MTAWLGIDPGLSGGLALVGGAVQAYPMPETERDVWNLITGLHTQVGIEFALIEAVHALPAAVEAKLGIQRGSIATAKLMQNYGSLRMALVAAGIPFDQITPPTWQKLMGCRTRGDKRITRARAQQLFPLSRVTHATADALLIAKACQILQAQQRGERIELPAPAPQPSAPQPKESTECLFDASPSR